MPITKQQQEGMRSLRIEGKSFAEIGKLFGIPRNSAFYYCCVVEDQELLERMKEMREGNRDISSSNYGIGMTFDEIGAVVDMNRQKVARWLSNISFHPRYCLHDHKRIVPRGKFRLWCNERCHRAWKRTIKLWEGREEANDGTTN